MTVTDVVTVSVARTPIGRLGGALSSVRPDDLAALVIQEAVRRRVEQPEAVTVAITEFLKENVYADWMCY